jgi:hypothetical protein
MLKIRGRFKGIPGELIEMEQFPTVDSKFTMSKYTVRVIVDGLAFIAEVHYGSYRDHVWKPNDVWVHTQPDMTNSKVKLLIEQEAAKAKLKGFEPDGGRGFLALCRQCETVGVVSKFRKELMLPDDAVIDVSANITIAAREIGSRPVHEDFVMIEQESYEFCLLHGAWVGYDEEPLD